MAQSSDACGVPALEQRRCLLLAAIGLTAESMPNNQTLNSLMNAGLLVTIKLWLAEIMDGKLGGVDLLLHLLTMITSLPVTKDMVTSSRLGKAVSAIEKDKICVGTKNEAAIKNRISEVKSRWSTSVKAQKSKSTNGTNNVPVKRQIVEETSSPPPVKKAKVEAPRASSLSNLLKKVENSNGKAASTATAQKKPQAFTIPKTSELKENNGTFVLFLTTMCWNNEGILTAHYLSYFSSIRRSEEGRKTHPMGRQQRWSVDIGGKGFSSSSSSINSNIRSTQTKEKISLG